MVKEPVEKLIPQGRLVFVYYNGREGKMLRIGDLS